MAGLILPPFPQPQTLGQAHVIYVTLLSTSKTCSCRIFITSNQPSDVAFWFLRQGSCEATALLTNAQLLFNSWSGMDKNSSSTLQHTSTNHDVRRLSLGIDPAFIGIFTAVPNPRHYGLQHEDIEILTSDRIILRCYLLRPPKTSSRTKASETSEPIELEPAVVCRHIQPFFNHDVAH
jgi:hypothetical protein